MENGIGKALRGARKKAGMTQVDLAFGLGVRQSLIADIERGEKRLPRRHYAKLPAAIRGPVIDAEIVELRRQIEELQAMRRSVIKYAPE
jgi:transcriptional regulator with XRE-family HTH domain